VFSGHLASDTLRIQGLSLPNLPFLNADRYNTAWLDFYDGYDGVLGLDPNTETDVLFPSPWSTMVQRGLLEKNLMAISPPSEGPATGELSFGDISPAYASSRFRSIPLVREGAAAAVWTVLLRSLTWANELDPLRLEFPAGATAVITSDWFVAVPRAFQIRWGQETVLGCDVMHMYCWVECTKRSSMPDIIVGLGDHEFRITAFQYAPVTRVQDGVERC